LGASRGRIVGIFVGEGLVIAVTAWMVASLMAFWMSKSVVRLIPQGAGSGTPMTFDFTPDWTVIGYAMVLAIAGTIMFSAARALPGVTSASFARRQPQESWATERLQLRGSEKPVAAERNDVGPGYFDALGVTPIAGAFEQHEAQTIRAAAINRHLAEMLWPGEDAVGRTVIVASRPDPVRVTAVIPNGYFSGYRREAAPNFVFLS